MLIKTFLLCSLSLFIVANAYKNPNFAPGRTTVIHLFEWKWNDIADECERFLGPNGYAGVQVSPPNEHANVQTPYRPWYQRYQPVSYKLESRSGTETQFRNMVARCNAVGVRIYVDAVINHMSAISGIGTANSLFDADKKYFPAVPFNSSHFNDAKCSTPSGNIESYQDIFQVRNCKLVKLPDLAVGNEYVRQKIAEYMNNLIDIGVAGFRVDAAKHMWPGDIQAILGKLKNLREDIYGASKRPFVYQEVIDLGGEAIKITEYSLFARVTEFKYGKHLSDVVSKSYNQKMCYLKNFGTGWAFLNGNDVITFVDNHDNQRGHGGGGAILNFMSKRKYNIANAFMLAWPYAIVQVMSSYNFDPTKDWEGPPSDAYGNTKDVVINSDGSCSNGWICEHRWPVISNMVKFRNLVEWEPLANWWDNAGHQIAFSRGDKGFIAINNEDFSMDVTLKTGLPAGQYCDIINGNKVGSSCTGKVVTVNADGSARINISNTEQNPMIAIFANSKL